MVEVDPDTELWIERSGSFTVVLLPLLSKPSKSWKLAFRRLARPEDLELVRWNGRTWVRLGLQGQGVEPEEAEEAVERLERAVEVVALTNRTEAEEKARGAGFDERLRSWWAEVSIPESTRREVRDDKDG